MLFVLVLALLSLLLVLLLLLLLLLLLFFCFSPFKSVSFFCFSQLQWTPVWTSGVIPLSSAFSPLCWCCFFVVVGFVVVCPAFVGAVYDVFGVLLMLLILC